MAKIRILIIDDSVIARRTLAEALGADPEMEIIAAPDGRIGLDKIRQTKPDLVTLDLEMPDMNGIAVLKEIRRMWPALPVIMFSALSEHGARAALEALAIGARDFVTKPTHVANPAEAVKRIAGDLIPKINAICRGPERGPAPVVSKGPRVVRPGAINRLRTSGILAIGSSTGGPAALAEVIPHIPAHFPVPIVIVQHMPPIFTKMLADRLSHQSRIPVTEAINGEVLKPGHCYIAPGGFHLVVDRTPREDILRTQEGPPENSCRPAVDVLFRSVAENYRDACLAVVLTGMGQDGLRGAEKIRDAGGTIWAQDEKTSVVWGMPGFVVKGGLADKTLPLKEIPLEINRLFALPLSAALNKTTAALAVEKAGAK